jgi:DNA processing protein
MSGGGKMNKYEINTCIENEIGVLSVQDEKYPKILRDIPNPPEKLYFLGDISALDNGVAMVGARVPSVYGVKQAEWISYELASNGVTIISGMARGIDTLCHKGALKANGRTIAVLGCGLDIAYPHENEELMNIIAKNGAVISEYPLGTPPLPAYFPQRNRIVSGLADCGGV